MEEGHGGKSYASCGQLDTYGYGVPYMQEILPAKYDIKDEN